jgi:hypothetical protein
MCQDTMVIVLLVWHARGILLFKLRSEGDWKEKVLGTLRVLLRNLISPVAAFIFCIVRVCTAQIIGHDLFISVLYSLRCVGWIYSTAKYLDLVGKIAGVCTVVVMSC